MRHFPRWLRLLPLFVVVASQAPGASGPDLWNWYLIPAAASNPGAGGTYWRLDLSVLNPYSWRAITVRMKFLREKTDNTSATYRDFVIAAGQQLALTDVVGTQFGVTGKGALELWTLDGAYFTPSARSYTTSPTGTYGHEVLGQDYAVGGGGRAFTSGIRVDSQYRTNIGAVNASSVGISVLAEILDGNGAARGSYTFNLLPWSTEQVAAPVSGGDLGPGSVRWTCLSSGTNIQWVAYATPVDNTSGDAIYLEERFDDKYTTVRPAWNLSGRWTGSLSIVGGGSEQVTVDLTEDGAGVTGEVYNTTTGCREMHLYGYENQGTLVFNGTPYLLQYKDDQLWGSGAVTSGTGIAGTFSGSGFYSGGGSFAISKAYSFAPMEATQSGERLARGRP